MKVGDTVRHKAGGNYAMVIETINANSQAFCTWLNADGESRNDTFSLLSLEPWAEEQEASAPKCINVGELRKAMAGLRDDQLVMVDNDQECIDAIEASVNSVDDVDVLVISINHAIGASFD